MRSNVRRNLLFRSPVTFVIPVCALLTLLFAFTHARLLRASGPREVSPQDGRAGHRGVLLAPAGGQYRFLLDGRTAAEILIDGRLVADHTMTSGGLPTQLDRRQHEVLVRYQDGGAAQRPDVLWARDGGHFRPVPRLLLVPERVSLREFDLRRVVARLELVVPFTWVGIAIAGMLIALRRWTSLSPAPTAALIAAAVLFTAGVLWGVPGPAGWAPDEVGPIDVRGALQAAFAGGWASIYPPFHHAVIALFYLPFEAAAAAGIGDVEDVAWSGALLAVGRWLSIIMALGIVWLAHRIALEQFGKSAGRLAAWLTLALLPLAYYAKTANLDVPYVFWLMLSLLFFARLFTGSPGASNFFGFTLFGVVAICTKDQAYGFYVLPGAYLLTAGLLGSRAGRWPAVPSRRVLGIMTCIAVVVFAVLHNLPFNVAGFTEHVRLIAGPGSARYAAFPNTPTGHIQMLIAAVAQIGQAMSWPIFVFSAIAVGSAVAHRAYAVLWLLLPCVSYYLTFITVVRYHYDRFFLGIAVVLAIAAAWWLDRWLAAPRGRTIKLTAIGIALTYGLGRSLALDVMMVRDPRYDAERWLREHVAPAQRVVAIGHEVLLPRSSVMPWRLARLNPELLNDTRPEFVIVNVGFAMRAKEGSAARQTLDLLEAGATGYERAVRFRGRAIPPLSWERRFQQIADDPYTNLTKVNPAIDIYVRKDVGGQILFLARVSSF